MNQATLIVTRWASNSQSLSRPITVSESHLLVDCFCRQLPVPVRVEGGAVHRDGVRVRLGARTPSTVRPQLYLHPPSERVHLSLPPGDGRDPLRERWRHYSLTAASTARAFVKLPSDIFFSLSAVSISDPFFSAKQSSWMSFPPVKTRHRTVLELQFQPLSPDGILVYMAQRLSARVGEELVTRSSDLSLGMEVFP